MHVHALSKGFSILPPHLRRRLKKWIFTEYIDAIQAGKDPLYPSFFFPSHISSLARSLIVQLLHPDPNLRLTATGALKHRWFNPPTRPNIRIDDTSSTGLLARHPSPNHSKVSGKPPRPTSGNGSPNQISGLIPVIDSSCCESTMIPSLSRNSSNNDLPAQPGKKLTDSRFSPNYSPTHREEKYVDITPSTMINEEDCDLDVNMLNLNSSDQVVYVEDDGDALVEDSIWRDTDDDTLLPSSSMDNSPNFSYTLHHGSS